MYQERFLSCRLLPYFFKLQNSQAYQDHTFFNYRWRKNNKNLEIVKFGVRIHKVKSWFQVHVLHYQVLCSTCVEQKVVTFWHYNRTTLAGALATTLRVCALRREESLSWGDILPQEFSPRYVFGRHFSRHVLGRRNLDVFKTFSKTFPISWDSTKI